MIYKDENIYTCPVCGQKSVQFVNETGVYINRGVWASTYECKECGLEFLMNPDFKDQEVY